MDIAAELTLRIARFIQMTADPPASPARWLFVPEFEHARWATAGELLANAPKPLIVAPLPDGGFLGTWFVGALTGVHRERAERQLENQQAFFHARIAHLGLKDSDAIVFDSGADETLIPVADFRRWLRDYAVCAGSTLDARASTPTVPHSSCAGLMVSGRRGRRASHAPQPANVRCN